MNRITARLGKELFAIQNLPDNMAEFLMTHHSTLEISVCHTDALNGYGSRTTRLLQVKLPYRKCNRCGYDSLWKLQPSKYYRCICGQHATVSGMLKHLTAEPDDEFPLMPPWQLGWVYLGGYTNHRYWRRDKEARA